MARRGGSRQKFFVKLDAPLADLRSVVFQTYQQEKYDDESVDDWFQRWCIGLMQERLGSMIDELVERREQAIRAQEMVRLGRISNEAILEYAKSIEGDEQ